MDNNSPLREHQLKAVDALMAFDVFCKKENIQYWLEGGSCLGAIRHKGFIPWDDDIDIDMNLTNFIKFKEAMKKSTLSKYVWKHTDVIPNYPSMTIKILDGDEPLITIFPLVKLSDDKFMAKTQWWIRKFFSPIYQRKCRYPLEKVNSLQILSLIVSSIVSVFFTKEQVLKILRWNERRYEDQETTCSINIYSRYSMKTETLKNEWYKESINAEFEGHVYPIVRDYDAYLTHLYGDYMTPPPVEERNADHLEIINNMKKRNSN